MFFLFTTRYFHIIIHENVVSEKYPIINSTQCSTSELDKICSVPPLEEVIPKEPNMSTTQNLQDQSLPDPNPADVKDSFKIPKRSHVAKRTLQFKEEEQEKQTQPQTKKLKSTSDTEAQGTSKDKRSSRHPKDFQNYFFGSPGKENF